MLSPHSYVPWDLLKKAKHTLAGEICCSASRYVWMHIIAPFAVQPLALELFGGVLVFYFEQTLLSIHFK